MDAINPKIIRKRKILLMLLISKDSSQNVKIKMYRWNLYLNIKIYLFYFEPDIGAYLFLPQSVRFFCYNNPIGAGGGTMCILFFQKAISPWKKGSGGPKFLDFS